MDTFLGGFMIKKLQEYYIDDSALHEWIPWGGLIHPSIIRNKDESIMAIFSYDEIKEYTEDDSTFINFVNGWVLWNECQHFNNSTKKFLTVLWNPFYSEKKTNILNGINGEKIKFKDKEKHFLSVLMMMKNYLTIKTNAKLLENDEVLSYLASTISMKKVNVEMQEIPLYLDVVLSDVQFKMLSNKIEINDKKIAIVSIPSIGQYRPFILNTLLDSLNKYEYRFCRRLLIFSKENAKKEVNKYMSTWCKNRMAVKDCIKETLLRDTNGFYMNSFIFFHEDENLLNHNIKYIQQIIEMMGLPYIIENKNYKDVWWGSIPGIFRANITPPIQGLKDLYSFL